MKRVFTFEFSDRKMMRPETRDYIAKLLRAARCNGDYWCVRIAPHKYHFGRRGVDVYAILTAI